jgi:hypothetical protein
MRFPALATLVLLTLATAADPTVGQEREAERHPTQADAFDGEGTAFDVVVIGRAVFVYRRSSLPFERDAVRDETRMISQERARTHGTPSPEVDRLIDIDRQADYGFDFEQAEVVSMGKAGLLWKITWRVSLKQGGGSGVPWRYRSYVKPDGTRIEPEMVLCDARNVAAQDRWIFSRMAFRDFEKRPAPTAVVHGDQVQQAAREKLTRFLNEAFPDDAPGFRFHDQRLLEIPVASRETSRSTVRELWEVRFADAGLQGPAILKGWPLVVWVTVDGRPAELSVDRWKLSETASPP